MHTDEFEIALSRELDVCIGYIRKHRRFLKSMETRHGMTTAVFMDLSSIGRLPPSLDFSDWRKSVEALQHWSATRDEYERLLGVMKISAA